MTPDELAVVAALAARGLRQLEVVDGVRSPELHELLRRFVLERDTPTGAMTMVASVSYLDDRRQVWKRCEECGRLTEKLRRGLCGAHYQAWRRGHTEGHTASL
jgi:hypothetical protein